MQGKNGWHVTRPILTRTAQYVYECWPDNPEWRLSCAVLGRAILDTAVKGYDPDFVVGYLQRYCEKAGADLDVACDLLIDEFESDIDWVYDLGGPC